MEPTEVPRPRGQALGVADRQVLGDPVGVMDEALEAVGARPDGHLERVQGELGTEGLVTRQPTMRRENTSTTNAV